MDDEQNNESNRLVAWILGIAVTIAIAVALIIGIVAALGSGSGTSASTAAGAGGSTATAEVDVAPDLATGPGYPALVRLHFETARFELPVDAALQLAPIADWAKAGEAAKIGISGFHDRHGDANANAVLARNRAVGARDALLAAGVPAGRIVMVKPQETTGGSDDREARRVDVYPAR